MKPCGSWLKRNRDPNAENGRTEAGLCSALPTPGKEDPEQGRGWNQGTSPQATPELQSPSCFLAENTPGARAKQKQSQGSFAWKGPAHVLGCSGGAAPPQRTGSNKGRIPYYQHFAFWWTLLFELFHSSPFLPDLPTVCPAPGGPSRAWTSEQCMGMLHFGQQPQKSSTITKDTDAEPQQVLHNTPSCLTKRVLSKHDKDPKISTFYFYSLLFQTS